MTEASLKVAVAQFPGTNVIEENKAYISDLCRQAAAEKAELLVFPEAAMCAFSSELAQLRAVATQHSSAFIEYMQDLAKTHGFAIVVGVLSPSEVEEDQRVVNQLIAIAADGEIITRYTKVHLYDAFSFKESAKVQPGALYTDNRELSLFSLKGFNIGLVNCYDLRFPELSRKLAVAGADILSISAAWLAGPYKESHWETLSRARAIENTCYVLASGQTAPKNTGQSMIIDPMGAILAGAGEEPGLIVRTLSKKRLSDVRTILPCLENRRYDV
ncbi:MAG: carbon-nitrogen hydrolase family protein [Alcaligenaceae bacterium]|nr:carbon-nitrogen hydrolase family protein [Alcaligenaceae bacterium]